MTEGRRQYGDIIHLIESRSEKKHILAGVLVSLLLHGGVVGKAAYDYWQQVKVWGDLLAIEIVDGPSPATLRRRAEIIALTQPLYYPPGLLKSDAARISQEQERRRQEEERRRQQERQRQEATEEAGQASDAQDPSPAPGDDASQPDALRAQLQQLRQGVERARTLNIGPIRDQIAAIYEAQQEGKIVIRDISVAVNFRVRQDGSFTHVQLVESSGIPQIDNAALLIVDELNELRSLAPLRETDSVTLRLIIGQDVELRVIAATPSEAVATEDVSVLNGLLMAARFWSRTQQHAQVARFLSNIEIKREGVNVVASARISRVEASQLLKKEIGSGN